MSRTTLRRPLGALAVLGAALALAYPRESQTGGVLRIAHEGGVISLDPAAVSEAATQSVLSNFYEGLVAFDGDTRLVPALATSWSGSGGRSPWPSTARPS